MSWCPRPSGRRPVSASSFRARETMTSQEHSAMTFCSARAVAAAPSRPSAQPTRPQKRGSSSLPVLPALTALAVWLVGRLEAEQVKHEVAAPAGLFSTRRDAHVARRRVALEQVERHATCRSIAMFSAALPVRTRLWSSSKAMSSTQWRLFSTDQWLRTAWANFWALSPARLLMKYLTSVDVRA